MTTSGAALARPLTSPTTRDTMNTRVRFFSAWWPWLQRATLATSVVALGLALGLSLWDAQRLPLTVALVAAAFALLLVTLDPLLGLAAWIAISPFAPFLNLDIHLGAGIPDLALTRLAAGWAVVLLLAQAARRQRRLAPPNLLDATLLLFGAAIILSGLTSVYGASAGVQAAFDAYLLPFLAYALARNLARTPRAARFVLLTVVVIGAYLAFLVVQEQATGRVLFALDTVQFSYGAGLRRVVSLLGNPIFFGIPLAFSVVAGSLLLAAEKRRCAQILLVLLLLAFVVAAFFTYNRASWAGVALGAIVLALFFGRLRRVMLPTLAALALVGVLTWPLLSQQPIIKERLADEDSVNDRLNNVTVALTLWRQAPIFGIGYGSFGLVALDQGLLPRIAKYIPAPHNSYLFVLTSGGLLALVPYLLSFAVIAFDLWRFGRRTLPDDAGAARRAARHMIAGGWAMLLIMVSTSLTYDVATGALTSLMFYFFIGAVYGVVEHAAGRA